MCQIVHIADFESRIADEILGMVHEEDLFAVELFDDELLDDTTDVFELQAEDTSILPFADAEQTEAVFLAAERASEGESRRGLASQAA